MPVKTLAYNYKEKMTPSKLYLSIEKKSFWSAFQPSSAGAMSSSPSASSSSVPADSAGGASAEAASDPLIQRLPSDSAGAASDSLIQRLPPELLERIIGAMAFEQVAVTRLVSQRFNRSCQSILNQVSTRALCG